MSILKNRAKTGPAVLVPRTQIAASLGDSLLAMTISVASLGESPPEAVWDSQ
jgi:hypothetical protein